MKTKNKLFALLIGVGFLIPTGALAQYTINAGKNVFKVNKIKEDNKIGNLEKR